MCPSCRRKIAWYDNIPLISFLILFGRCRQCRQPISWRYPMVEFLTTVLFVAFGSTFFSLWNIQSWLLVAFYLVLVSILLLIFFYDLETMEIPNILLWIGVGFSLPMLLVMDSFSFLPVASPWSLRLYQGVFAGLVGFLPLFLMAAISRERWMGMGDGFLAFLIGLMVGWSNMILALLFAFSGGAIIGLILISLKRKDLQSRIPLGPFLVFGAILSILVPENFPGLLVVFPWWYW